MWTQTDADDPAPAARLPSVPNLPRRQVYTSLSLTICLLLGTVGLVYWLFPERDHVFETRAFAAHTTPGPWELVEPSLGALHAWAHSIFDDGMPQMAQRFEDAPLPTQGASVLGARMETLLGRPTAIVRYRLDDAETTLLFQRARGVGPGPYHETIDGTHIETWRHGGWTMTVVGTEASVRRLRALLATP